MVISCSVPTCKNRFQKGGDVQFHSFPLKREDMCRRWADAIGRINWMPTKNSFVCSQHFTTHDYQLRAGKHKHFLRETAIPSIFNPMTPRRKGNWRQAPLASKRLPFILPSHLEITNCTPSRLQPAPLSLLPTTLPSGVSIVPLKKIQPRPPVTSKVPIPRYAEPYHQSPPSQNNGIPYKKMKSVTSLQNNLPILHPSNNTSVFITSKPMISSHFQKPVPNLNPIYQDRNGENDEQYMDEQPGDIDVTQFLSISLTPEEDSKANNNIKNLLSTPSSSGSTIETLKRKCNLLQQEIGKRDSTIKTMQYQMRDMRKKMDSISIQKILKDNFNGLTYEILESYLNNTNLDSYEKRYTDNIKDFAMKLFECSEDAYSMVRQHFDLPHPSNVIHWLRANRDEDLDESGNNLSPQSSASGNYSGHENFEAEDLNGFNIKIEPEDTYE